MPSRAYRFWELSGHLRYIGAVATMRALTDLVHPSWAMALAPVTTQMAALGAFLHAERESGRGYLPAGEQVLRAFAQPMDSVRVLVVGQDPYPNPGHAVGLAFSVSADVDPIPRSLQNIYHELETDLGVSPPGNGDLSPWADRGVMLLNKVLTVSPGLSGSHRGKGWEVVTRQAISALSARGGPLVSILWGQDAQAMEPSLQGVPCIKSPHPSPLSARTGFFGSRPFSRVNDLLRQQGADPVDWSLS
jgi:uracil-DNA glycosylase